MFYSLLADLLMALDYRGQYVDRFRAVASHLVEPVFWAVDLPFLAPNASPRAGATAPRTDAESELELELAEGRPASGRLPDLESKMRSCALLLETARGPPGIHCRRTGQRRSGSVRPPDPGPARPGRRHSARHAGYRFARRSRPGRPGACRHVPSHPDFGPGPCAAGPDPAGRRAHHRLRQRIAGPPQVDRSADEYGQVRPGDLVVTSGIGGRFPPGLPVARIESVQRQPGQAFATAFAAPLSAMDRNRLVLILEPNRSNIRIREDAPAEQPPDRIRTGQPAIRTPPMQRKRMDTPTPGIRRGRDP